MTIETMDTTAQPISSADAWRNAQAALAAQSGSGNSSKVATETDKLQNNKSQNAPSLTTSEQPALPQQPSSQQWMPPNHYQDYSYPPPPPADYESYPEQFTPSSYQSGYGGPPARPAYSSHFNQSAPGVRFTLTNQNKFQNNQLRYQSPNHRMPMRPPYMNWRHAGSTTLTAPPPPPSTDPPDESKPDSLTKHKTPGDPLNGSSVKDEAEQGNHPTNSGRQHHDQQHYQQSQHQQQHQPHQQQHQQPQPHQQHQQPQPHQQQHQQPQPHQQQQHQHHQQQHQQQQRSQQNQQQHQPAAPQVQPVDKSAQMSEWPPSMKAWVTRCFAAASSDEDKDKMEKKLKEVITDSFARDRVKTTDWDTYPVPQLAVRPLAASTIPMPPMMSNMNNRLGASPHMQSRGRGKRGRGGRGRGSRFSDAQNQPGGRGRGRSRSRSRSGSRYSRSSRSRSRERYSNRKRSTRDRSRSRSRGSNSSEESISKANFIPLHSRVSKNIWKNSKPNKKPPKAGGALGKRLGAKQKKMPQYKATMRDRVNIQKRVARFGDQLQIRSQPLQLAINTYADEDGEDVWDENSKIVGTSRDIEKQYLRLTSAPAASDVRPVHVLYKSLENVKSRWVEKRDYRWTCEQFKSIRQDLTVQCIRDCFTAKVYETHARVALEAADHCEFNQCQTQLKALYSEGVRGCSLEFISYRILYYVFTANTIDMISALSGLKAEEKQDPCVSFALAFRSAWSLNNYHRMLKLYRTAPKMTGHVIDLFLPRERIRALKTMVKGFRPSLPIEWVQAELGYDDSSDDRDSLLKFLLEQGANLTADSSKIDCKNGLNPPPVQS